MDMHTLHVAHAVLLGLYTLLTVINCRLHQGVRGMYWFPVYTFFAMFGAILIALRGRIPEPVSIILGMTLFHLAYLCLYHCLADFFQRKSLRWAMPLQGAATFVSFLALLQYGFIHRDTQRRLIVFSLVFALQLGMCAVLIFRNAPAHLRVPSALMGGILGLLGLNNFVRAVTIMIHGAPLNYLDGGSMLQWALLTTTVLQGGITVAFVWLTAAVLHEKLRSQAETDFLTGLLNRRALQSGAQAQMALSLAEGRPLAAILIDLDQFKQINDTLGHAFGDLTLVQVARCLEGSIRSTDLLGRIGGDEFAIVLQNTDWETAVAIAEQVRLSLESLRVADDVSETTISASIGLAQMDELTHTWPELMVRCDRALYAVKDAGGNLVLTS